jgi:hypothetical protein
VLGRLVLPATSGLLHVRGCGGPLFSSIPFGGLSLDEVFSSESESESGFLFEACKPALVCYLCTTL